MMSAKLECRSMPTDAGQSENRGLNQSVISNGRGGRFETAGATVNQDANKCPDGVLPYTWLQSL